MLIALGRWGARAPGPPDGVGMSFDAHILSLQTLFRPELAGGFETTFELRFGDDPFIADVRAGQLFVERGEAHRARRRHRGATSASCWPWSTAAWRWPTPA